MRVKLQDIFAGGARRTREIKGQGLRVDGLFICRRYDRPEYSMTGSWEWMGGGEAFVDLEVMLERYGCG